MHQILTTLAVGIASAALLFFSTMRFLHWREARHTAVQMNRIRDPRAWRLNVQTRWSRDEYEG